MVMCVNFNFNLHNSFLYLSIKSTNKYRLKLIVNNIVEGRHKSHTIVV
jgi:HKD family nuclease